MSSIHQETTNTNPTNRKARIDPVDPHAAGAARMTTPKDDRARNRSGGSRWLWIILAAVAALLLIGWFFTGGTTEAVVAPGAGEAPVSAAEVATAPVEGALTPSGLEIEESAAPALIEVTDDVTTVPVQPVD
jgi:hypothetical protein